MALFGICPYCGSETEIDNSNSNYCMCHFCNKIYNTNNHAKIQGIAVSESRLKELEKEIEKDVGHIISNWRFL